MVGSKRCFFWHIKSVWQSLASKCDVIIKRKWNRNLLKVIEDFLAKGCQRFVLNGQASGRALVNAEIPQGSILRSLLLLVYINEAVSLFHWINQLVSITQEIYKSFDHGWEGRGVFLEISKAFEKVWHQGVISDFKKWSRKLANAGVSQTLILDPFPAGIFLLIILLFFNYISRWINSILANIHKNIK